MTDAQTAVPATVFAATPVLFDADGELDVGALHRLHTALTGTGVDGQFVAGTTGEFPALEEHERLRVFETAAGAAGPDTVIAHVGAASARQAVRLTRQARRMGLTRLAAITPFYLRAGRTETHRYFSEIAEAADGADLYVYAFEHVTNNPVPADLLAELAKLPGVRGVKLSGVAGTELIREYVAAAPEGFAVLSGSDRELADVARAGGTGVVSGVSSALPGPFVRLAAAVRSGDTEAEARAQQDVDTAVGLLGASAAALKTALAAHGYPATCRMPIAPVPHSERARIDALINREASLTQPAGPATH